MTDLATWARVRPYRGRDESFCLYSWLFTFARSEHGKRWNANALRQIGQQDHVWSEHRPIALRLLREADTRIACDNDDDDTILGWACVDGPGVLHYAAVKHTVGRELAPDVARLLLGDRLDSPQLVTHEQCGLRVAGVRHVGEWKFDPYWLASKWAKEAA